MSRATRFAVTAAGLLASTMLAREAAAAEPLAELSARLEGLRSAAPMRIEVDVEHKHRGSAPLHLRRTTQRGGAVIAWGPDGVESLEQWWLGVGARVTVWEQAQRRPVIDGDDRVLGDQEAAELADPAGALADLLEGATLLGDETAEWDGRPARRLTIRPGLLSPAAREERGDAPDVGGPLRLLLVVWLDDAGDPIAAERAYDFDLGPFSAHQRQTFVLERANGRLVVGEMRETWTGNALAVMKGRDDRLVVLRSADVAAEKRAG